MSKQARKNVGTRNQAQQVRAYLASIGHPISHTQALEVIARGHGLRSRHVLATPATVQPAASPSQLYTVVHYRYVDGSNNKRFDRVLFRGLLTKDELLSVYEKLDDHEYFVASQVGLRPLQGDFSHPGEDHGWHACSLGDPKHWSCDAQGNVRAAGDVEVLELVNPSDVIDADAHNFAQRFRQVREWDPDAEMRLLGLDRDCAADEDEDEDESAEPNTTTCFDCGNDFPDNEMVNRPNGEGEVCPRCAVPYAGEPPEQGYPSA